MMTGAEVVELLRKRIAEEGVTRTGFALKYNISQGHLWNVLEGRAKPGPTISAVLGLKQVLMYEKIK